MKCVLILSCWVLQGREEGAQIDPWEDPAFEVYHVTDRYGFIQYVHFAGKAALHSVLLDLAVQFMILEKYSFSFTLCSMICWGGGGGIFKFMHTVFVWQIIIVTEMFSRCAGMSCGGGEY